MSIRNKRLINNDLEIDSEYLYKGPWQFVPIVVLKHMVVFGFDSGIARGGIGVFCPEHGRWSFIFLKWVNKSVKTCHDV